MHTLSGPSIPDIEGEYWRINIENPTEEVETQVSTEVRLREYLCASLESRIMEDDFCATTKRECVTCFYDLYLSAIGCKCSPHIYTCLLHAKQLCACAWSEKYLLVRYGIDELSIMVEALDRKVSEVHKLAKEKNGLPVYDVSKDDSKKVGMATVKAEAVITDVELFPESISHRSTSRRASEIQEYKKVDVFFASSVGPSSTKNSLDLLSGSCVGATDALNHQKSQSQEDAHYDNKVLLPKTSQHTAGGETTVTSSSTVHKKHLARGSSLTVRT